MKPALFLFCVLFLLKVARAQEVSISDFPLTWSDFRIVEGSNNNYAASVDTRISYQLNMTYDKGYSISTKSYVDNASSVVTKQFFDGANTIDKERCLRHEKGHYVICLIQQKKFHQLLAQSSFGNPIQEKVDSLFGLVQKEWRIMNLQYDQATDHGKNGAQDQWENNLMNQFNILYKGISDYSSLQTVLKVSNEYTKITDPLMYQYTHPIVCFNYSFQNNRINSNANPVFPVSLDTPYHHTLTDSTIYIDSLNFNRDFEAELTFSFQGKRSKNDPALVIGWTMQRVSYVDAENTGLSIAPSSRTFFGFQEKGKRKKKGKLVSSFVNLNDDTTHHFAIRKIGNSYHAFIDGRFEKELICIKPDGKRFYVFVAKGLCNLLRVKFTYL